VSSWDWDEDHVYLDYPVLYYHGNPTEGMSCSLQVMVNTCQFTDYSIYDNHSALIVYMDYTRHKLGRMDDLHLRISTHEPTMMFHTILWSSVLLHRMLTLY
jgi:hypothetical protein